MEGLTAVLPHVGVGLLLAVLGAATVFREKASFSSLLFCTVVFLGAIWQFGNAGVLAAPNESAALTLSRLEKAAVVFIPTAVLFFTLAILDQLRKYLLLAWGCLMLSSAFCLVVIGTDAFIAGVHHYPWGYFPRYGPWSPAFLAFFFLTLAFSLVLYSIEYRRSISQTQRNRLRGLLAAFGIAGLGSVDYLPAYGIPIRPFGYLPVALFCTIIAWVLWRYRLVEITPAFAARQILKTMADVLLVVDLGGIVRVANQTACHLFGKTESQIVGQPIWSISGEFLPPERFQRSVRSKAIQSFESIYRTKGGRPLIFEVSASSLRDQEDRTVGIVCIARDTTERKKSEEKLQKAHADLRESHEELMNTQLQLIQAVKMESVGRLAAGVAHEVKNPLAIIVQGVEYLSQKMGSGTEESTTVLDYTREAVHRADRVIKGMLDFSRTQGLELQMQDLNQVIQQALFLTKHELDKHHVTLVEDLAPLLPHLSLDGTKIQQVFVNLFINAIQAMPEGGLLTLRTYVRPVLEKEALYRAGNRGKSRFWPGDFLVVAEVRDTGTGVPKEILNKIFDPFFTTKPTGQGTGLGLTVTKAILELHEAVIHIENRPEGGAQVTLLFPVPPAEKQPDIIIR